jgi:hypothetical protein
MRALFVWILLGGVAGAKPKPATAPGLLVHSATQGADVFVDGQKVGTTPMVQPVPMSPGEHTIKVVKPGFAPLIDVFRVAGKTTRVDADLVPIAGVLKVNCNVENARIFVDDKFSGQAPTTVEVQAGPRVIRVVKGGYKDQTQKIVAVAGEEISVDISLEELPVGINPYKPLPPPPKKTRDKWWVWTLGAVGIGAIITVVVVPVVVLTRDPTAGFPAEKTFTVGGP